MKVMKEAKLNEAKEELPVSFLTDFISKGWEEVGYLKATIESIKESYSGTKKVEELVQSLVDAYLVCIGQLELHIHKEKYIDYPEESGLAEGKDLKEAIELKVDGDQIEITTEPDTVVAVDEQGDKIMINNEGAHVEEPCEGPACEEPVCVGPDCDVPPVVNPIEPVEVPTEVNPFDDPFGFDAPEAENVRDDKPTPVGDTFDYFVDFDDPDMSQPALTDKDIYGEGDEPIEEVGKVEDEIEVEDEDDDEEKEDK